MRGKLHYLQNHEPDLCPKTSSFCQSQAALDNPLIEISERGQQTEDSSVVYRSKEDGPINQTEDSYWRERTKPTATYLPLEP
jgi:hypothetical protein